MQSIMPGDARRKEKLLTKAKRVAKQTHSIQRPNAAIRERERLKEFNESLRALQKVIPIQLPENKKLHKKQTLQLACRYIQFLQDCLDGKCDWNDRRRFWCDSNKYHHMLVAIDAAEANAAVPVNEPITKQNTETTVLPNIKARRELDYRRKNVNKLESKKCQPKSISLKVPKPNIAFSTDPYGHMQDHQTVEQRATEWIIPKQNCDISQPSHITDRFFTDCAWPGIYSNIQQITQSYLELHRQPKPCYTFSRDTMQEDLSSFDTNMQVFNEPRNILMGEGSCSTDFFQQTVTGTISPSISFPSQHPSPVSTNNVSSRHGSIDDASLQILLENDRILESGSTADVVFDPSYFEMSTLHCEQMTEADWKDFEDIMGENNSIH